MNAGGLPPAALELLQEYEGLCVWVADGSPRAFYGRTMNWAATPNEAEMIIAVNPANLDNLVIAARDLPGRGSARRPSWRAGA